jgi:RNA polymerase sigma-70 factor, ECF subfamily
VASGRHRMDEPDPRVIRSAAAGDEHAFTALMRSVQPHVWRFVRHLLGDDEQAADVTQETFIRVHRSLDRFRFDARFSTWLFHIARNAAVDEQRRSKRRQRLAAAIARPEPGQDATLGVELKAAVAALSPRLREAFVVVEVFGLPYQDAADVLGVPTGTVKSRVFRARLELVSWFDEGARRTGGVGG